MKGDIIERNRKRDRELRKDNRGRVGKGSETGDSGENVFGGIETKRIVELLGVSDKFVSKWKVKYEREGVAALRLQHKGSQGYLKEERVAVLEWIGSRETITTDELIEELKEKYGVVYQSKQSYYDLLKAGRMSWHKREKSNPKKDMGAVIAKRQEIKKTVRAQ